MPCMMSIYVLVFSYCCLIDMYWSQTCMLSYNKLGDKSFILCEYMIVYGIVKYVCLYLNHSQKWLWSSVRRDWVQSTDLARFWWVPWKGNAMPCHKNPMYIYFLNAIKCSIIAFSKPHALKKNLLWNVHTPVVFNRLSVPWNITVSACQSSLCCMKGPALVVESQDGQHM